MLDGWTFVHPHSGLSIKYLLRYIQHFDLIYFSISFYTYLSIKNKVVFSQITNSYHQAKFLVTHSYDSIVTEYDCLASIPWSGQFGEDKTHYKGLDDASKNCLERNNNHGFCAVCCGLSRSIPYCVLCLQRKQKTRSKTISDNCFKKKMHGMIWLFDNTN